LEVKNWTFYLFSFFLRGDTLMSRSPRVGDRVVIERDETRFPPKGTWPQFRGRKGTVVEVNRDRKHPHLTEYGLSFGPTRRRPDGSLHGDNVPTWFLLREIVVIATALAPESPAEGGESPPSIKDTLQDSAPLQDSHDRHSLA
jgi:hypothetical protein